MDAAARRGPWSLGLPPRHEPAQARLLDVVSARRASRAGRPRRPAASTASCGCAVSPHTCQSYDVPCCWTLTRCALCRMAWYMDGGLNETTLLQQADAMAATLRPHGWTHILHDYGWQVCGDTAHPQDGCIRIDAFGRVLPAWERYPSTAKGGSWKTITEYHHGKGLAFGLHLIVGIPKLAAARKTPIKVPCACVAHVRCACHAPRRAAAAAACSCRPSPAPKGVQGRHRAAELPFTPCPLARRVVVSLLFCWGRAPTLRRTSWFWARTATLSSPTTGGRGCARRPPFCPGLPPPMQHNARVRARCEPPTRKARAHVCPCTCALHLHGQVCLPAPRCCSPTPVLLLCGRGPHGWRN